MKKFLAILTTVLLILTGMHVTIASHFCNGELAATKFSLSGKIASCGMLHDVNSASSEASFSSNCCEDETSVYKVDENFSTSEFNFKQVTQHLIQEFHIPSIYINYPDFSLFAKSANVSPPGYYLSNAMSLADICVFRI